MKSNDLTNATSTHPLDAYFNDYDHPKTATVTELETKELNEHFNDQDRQKVQSLADQIEPLNHDSLLKFGSNAQTHLSHFSHQMLDEIQSKDVGPIGETLEQLMKKLKEVNPDELSQQNKDYFDVLNLYIAAAEQKKTEIEQHVLPEIRQRVKAADDQMVVQDVADMEQFVDRLEKRIYDLKLSRQISLQSAPQIRMIQNVNQALAEKIQSSILTSIPLWKNQMAIALTLQRQQKAATAQKQVTDTTNEILLRNSEMLRQNARVTAEENERGIVDIETLKTTQDNIIQTIEETLQIQQEGREKRQQAEKDLLALESDLKARLTTAKDQRDRQ
ncbi:toxic anion resistance protein [Staphylococcus pseudintermedius]|nr:toxic anion resistance protein [Staphylococcus pseudintermedius]EHT3645363.1 toxic anion resistance protein [Staphylococcus pseudintermedius]